MGLLSVPLKTILPYHADLQGESIPESYAACIGQTLGATDQDINPGGTYTLPDLRNRFLLGADLTKAAFDAGTTGTSATDAPGPKGVGGLHAKTLSTAEMPAHVHTASTASAGDHTHVGSTASSGGAHTHTNTVTSAGAHSHSGSTTSTAGAHAHVGSSMTSAGNHVHGISDPGHNHTTQIEGNGSVQSGGGPYNATALNNMGKVSDSKTTGITILAAGDHQHTLSISTDGAHSHTFTLSSDGTHVHTVTIDSGGAHTHTLSIASDGAHTHSVTVNSAGGGTAFDMRPRYYGIVYIMKVKK